MNIWNLEEGAKYLYISPKGFSRQVICLKVRKDEAYFYYPALEGFGGDGYTWHNEIEIKRYIH